MAQHTNEAHRGVRVPNVTGPKVLTMREFWGRRVPMIVAGAMSPAAVAMLGAERTRSLLNKAAGTTVYFTDERIMPSHGGILGVHGFILGPGGCEWPLKNGGGCTFCSYQHAVDEFVGKLPPNEQEYNALFMGGFATMQHTCDAICYFTAGSALNPWEIPVGTMRHIANAVARALRPKMLRVESRVQWIRPEAVRPLVEILAEYGKTLDIAVGFETQDDIIRNKLLNKGMHRKQFEEAMRIAHAAGARVTAYIMLKGHWAMGEGFAIEECVKSIEYVFAHGVAEVQLQPLFICADGSEMERQYHAGNITPPRLWSVAEVFRRTLNLGPVILGPLDTEVPPPIALPENCPACTPAFMERIVRWRTTFDQSVWTDPLPECSCRQDWEEEVRNTQAPPPEITRSRKSA